MRLWLLAFGISSLLALCAFAADPLVLNVPPEIFACLPATFTWSGGTSPYSLSYRVGSWGRPVGDETNIGEPVLIGQTEGTQMTFEVPDYPREAVKFILIDRESIEQDAWFVIQASTECGGPHPFTTILEPPTETSSSPSETHITHGPSTVIHIPTITSQPSSFTVLPSPTNGAPVTGNNPSISQGTQPNTPGQSGTSASNTPVSGTSASGENTVPVESSVTAGPGNPSQSLGQPSGGSATGTRTQGTAPPLRSQSTGDDNSSSTPISAPARNAIIGTVIGALVLLCGLFCWQWRRRQIATRKRRAVVPVLPRASSWRDDEQGIMSEQPGQPFISLNGERSPTSGELPQTPAAGRRIAPEIREEELQAMMALHASSLNSAPSRPRAQSRPLAPSLTPSSPHTSSPQRPNIVTASQIRSTYNAPLSSSVPATPDTPSASVQPLHDPSRPTLMLPSSSNKLRREFGRQAAFPNSPSSMRAASMQALAPSTVYSVGETASTPSVRQVGQVHLAERGRSSEEDASLYPDDSSHEEEPLQAPPLQTPSYTAHEETGHVSLQGLITRELEHLFTQNQPTSISVDTSDWPASHLANSKSRNGVGEGSSQPHRRLQVVNTMDGRNSRSGVSDSEEDNLPTTPHSSSSAAPSSRFWGHATSSRPTVAPLSTNASENGAARRLVMSRQDMECLADLVAARINQGHGSHLSPLGSTGTHGPHTLRSVGHDNSDDVPGLPPPSYG